MSIESVMPSNHLIVYCLLLLLPSIFPSIRVFSNELALHTRWPKYWSFSFSISPSDEYSGLISCRIDWFDFLAVQGTLKSLFQHHSSKATVWHPAFFMVQLLHLYMTTGKTIALSIQTCVSKVMSLLFNILFFIAFLPRSMRLLISWLQSQSTVILEPKTGWAKKHVQVFPQDVTEDPKRPFDQFNITFLFYFLKASTSSILFSVVGNFRLLLKNKSKEIQNSQSNKAGDKNSIIQKCWVSFQSERGWGHISNSHKTCWGNHRVDWCRNWRLSSRPQ